MRSEITRGKEFNIISRSVDNASRCKVIEAGKDYFKVELDLPGKYETDESVELFSVTEKGRLYFETIVKEADNNIISLWYPIISKYLQRREFSRVKTDKTLVLYDESGEIEAKIADISAGGLKLYTEKPLELLKEYKTTVKIEAGNVETIFQPIRTESFENGFISSGRFKNLNNIDRISLVQYCFVKQIENSSL